MLVCEELKNTEKSSIVSEALGPISPRPKKAITCYEFICDYPGCSKPISGTCEKCGFGFCHEHLYIHECLYKGLEVRSTIIDSLIERYYSEPYEVPPPISSDPSHVIRLVRDTGRELYKESLELNQKLREGTLSLSELSQLFVITLRNSLLGAIIVHEALVELALTMVAGSLLELLRKLDDLMAHWAQFQYSVLFWVTEDLAKLGGGQINKFALKFYVDDRIVSDIVGVRPDYVAVYRFMDDLRKQILSGSVIECKLSKKAILYSLDQIGKYCDIWGSEKVAIATPACASQELMNSVRCKIIHGLKLPRPPLNKVRELTHHALLALEVRHASSELVPSFPQKKLDEFFQKRKYS